MRRRRAGQPQDLDALDPALLARPVGDAAGGGGLALGDLDLGDLDPVHLHLGEQQPRQLELLLRPIGDVRRLFAVAQGRVHYLDSLFIGLGGHLRRLPFAAVLGPKKREAAGCLPAASETFRRVRA
jgi:hypothetical protein